MSIITRSNIISVAAGTSSPASSPTKYNNTESYSRAKLRFTTSRSISPFPINVKHNQTKSTMSK